jgi:isoleucyl-tRNA synthetase
MATVRRLVELGRAARADSKVKTRQPLSKAFVSAPGWDAVSPQLQAEVAEELNVEAVVRLADSQDLVDVSVKPNFRELGKRFGPRTKQVADAIGAADVGELTRAVRDTGTATVLVDAEPIEVYSDDVIVSETPRSGWAVASSGADTVALDLELTHELRLAGLARDVIRLIQDARKNAGLEVTDRIALRWQIGGRPEPAEAIRAHAAQLTAEVLATDFAEGPPGAVTGWFPTTDEELGLHLWLRRA